MKILHLFEYPLKDINLNKVKEQGFDSIQISPTQPCKENGTWWGRYQPLDFSIGNSLGSKQDLINLCAAAEKIGFKIIVDVVVNHLASKDYNNKELHENVSERLRKREYFKDINEIQDWNNRYEVINKSIGVPTLNTANTEVQIMVSDFLNELIDCGVSGFRFDSAKNIALPEEGCNFWINVLGELKRKDLFNYAEVINSDSQLIEAYQKYINVLTEGTSWDKNKLVVFADSHDLHLTFRYTENLSDSMLIHEYEVLRKNFINTIFYARPFNMCWESEEIKRINFES